ncbi:MAG TPA: hypothetical protein VMI54_10455 [Polyangiaceae bacterium]|nr:hypothetical protein [Polyangiaceae bacterium]
MGSLVLGGALLAPAARATDEYVDSDARVAARVLAAQGSEAFEQHDYERALGLFERAGAIIPAPTITLMEARTLVELGRLVEALEKYGATQRMLAVDPTNEAFKQAADAAQHETEPILQRIPTLRVQVHGVGQNDKVEIQIDGKKVMPSLAAVDQPSDPGPHRVIVRAADGRTAMRDVNLAERAHEDVELTLAPLAAPSVPAPEPPRERQRAVDKNPENTLGWALVISGGTFAGVGLLTGVMALNNKATLDRECKPGCPPADENTLDGYRRERTVSYFGFGLGALALAGGAYLVVTHPARSVGVALWPGGVAMAGSFR